MKAPHRPFLTALAKLTLLSSAAALPVTAWAQADTSSTNAATRQIDNGKTYPADFFAAYSPSNASEMINRIPGFQVSSADVKRGLGQGGANVLVNGERLTGKSDVGGQLSRISAKNVVRIEILDGASLDIPGLSGEVANIVTQTSGVSGTWRWSPEFRKNQKGNFGHFHATVSGETGNISYNAELRQESQRNGHWGPETLTAADGTLFETREEFGRYNSEVPGATLDLVWKPKTDHIGNLNLEYNQYNSNNTELSDRRAVTERGLDRQTQFSSAEDEWNAKIGADYELPLGPGKLKTIGYFRTEHSPTVSRFDVFELDGTQTSGSRFFQTADEGEAIGRTEYSWAPQDGRDWSLGIEGAFNYLDIEQRLLVLDDGDFVVRPLDSDTRVQELRAEATLTHSRKLSEKWDVQASVGAEFSQISQTGQSVAVPSGEFVREFVRPKGFVSASYKPSDDFTIRTRAEREVGQLSFFDFISSVDVRDDLGNVANLNLVPEQSWLGSIEFDKNFGDGNTFKVKFYGAKISDIVDRIPIGVDGDAVGNIDSAYRYGIDTNATFKGDKWGLPGTQLDLEFDLRNSSVDDPLTGQARRINSDKKSYWAVNFRHDIPKTEWAYGFSADQYHESAGFRLNTINDYTFDGPFGVAFIEHKDVFGMKLIMELLNLFDASDDFERKIFTARRDLGELDFTERNSRDFDLFVRFTLSGTF